MKPSRIIIVLVTALSAFACLPENDADSVEFRAEASRHELCHRQCSKLDMCDSRVDVLDCADDCAANRSSRIAALEVFVECIEEASCNEISEGETFDCISDSIRVLPLTPAGRELCASVARKAELCAEDNYDETEVIAYCERLPARLFSDSLLNGVDHCFDNVACDQVPDCIEDVADAHDAELGIGSFLPQVQEDGEE